MLFTTSGNSPTCCAASSDHPPTNTDDRRNRAPFWPSSRGSTPSPPANVRCRSGHRGAPPSAGRMFRGERDLAGEQVQRAAASSGRAEVRRADQISAIDGALAVVRASPVEPAPGAAASPIDGVAAQRSRSAGHPGRYRQRDTGNPSRRLHAHTLPAVRAAAARASGEGTASGRQASINVFDVSPHQTAGVGPPPAPAGSCRCCGRGRPLSIEPESARDLLQASSGSRTVVGRRHDTTSRTGPRRGTQEPASLTDPGWSVSVSPASCVNASSRRTSSESRRQRRGRDRERLRHLPGPPAVPPTRPPPVTVPTSDRRDLPQNRRRMKSLAQRLNTYGSPLRPLPAAARSS